MKGLAPLQSLTITAYSRVFTGTYKSRIIELRPEGILIETPVDRGRLVLMGAGTRLKITVESPMETMKFEAELLKRLNDDEMMLITRPDRISRGGRILDQSDRGTRVIAFTSGKGGVGKSTLTLNFALSLINEGFRVGVIDADLGTANLDILLGIKIRYNLSDVIFGKKDIREIIVQGPEGLLLVPGGSGFQELTELSDWQFTRLINGFNFLDSLVDYILIDTGAGLSRNVTNFLLAADEIIVVTTPEPHCITDGYAIIKVISELKRDKPSLYLLINKADHEKEGKSVGEKMVNVAAEFLNLDIQYLGTVEDDKAVVKSIKERVPVILSRPYSTASRNIKKVVSNYLNKDEGKGCGTGVTGFLQRFKGLLGDVKELL